MCINFIFVDDTTILFEGNNIHSIVTSLNYELGKLIIGSMQINDL